MSAKIITCKKDPPRFKNPGRVEFWINSKTGIERLWGKPINESVRRQQWLIVTSIGPLTLEQCVRYRKSLTLAEVKLFNL